MIQVYATFYNGNYVCSYRMSLVSESKQTGGKTEDKSESRFQLRFD